MFSRKQKKVTARGNGVLKTLLKDQISETWMKLENSLLEKPSIPLTDSGLDGSYICFDAVRQAEVLGKQEAANLCLIAFQKDDEGPILLENPAELLRALTSVDISAVEGEMNDLVPILEARMPKRLRDALGRLQLSDIADMSSELAPMRLSFIDPGVQLNCQAWATESQWLRLFERDCIENIQIQGELSSGVKLPMPCRIGEIDITMKQWQSLMEGDVVILDRASFDALGKGAIELFGADYKVQFKAADDGSVGSFQII